MTAATPTRLLYRDSPNDAPLGPAWRTVGDVLRDSPAVRRIRETPEYVEDAANLLGWVRQLADHEIDRATFRANITGPMIFRSCAVWGYQSEAYNLLCEALRWKIDGVWQ